MRKKTMVMIALIVAIFVMATGYAILRQQLVITGTSSITSTWQVRIVGVTTSDIVGDAANKSTPTYTNTTAKFKTSLINPGDSITYNIKIKNTGTLTAKLSNYNVDIGDNDAIEYTVTGIEKNSLLVPQAEQTIKVKVSFKTGYVGQPSVTTNNIKVIINYVQNIDTSNQTNPISPGYRMYSIGNTVNYLGSDWYVIKNSDSTEDYVTLLKKEVETDLGKPAFGSSQDYNQSSIKTLIENYYFNTKGISSSLKSVDGYKVRLLNRADLNNVSGSLSYKVDEDGSIVVDYPNFMALPTIGDEDPSESLSGLVPTWIYSNYGENSGNSVYGFWTMIPSTKYIRCINTSSVGNLLDLSYSVDGELNVRPVINLLKSELD